MTANHTLWPRLVRHAAWSQARFHVKANRKTSYEDVYGTSYTSPVVPIAETALFREPRPDHRRLAGNSKDIVARQRKAEAQWEHGVWLGRSDEADDHLIGTARGIIRTRDVRRLETSKRHKLKVLTETLGVHWSFTASGVPRLMAPRTPATIALPASMTPMPPGFALGTAAPGTPAGSFCCAWSGAYASRELCCTSAGNTDCRTPCR